MNLKQNISFSIDISSLNKKVYLGIVKQKNMIQTFLNEFETKPFNVK